MCGLCSCLLPLWRPRLLPSWPWLPYLSFWVCSPQPCLATCFVSTFISVSAPLPTPHPPYTYTSLAGNRGLQPLPNAGWLWWCGLTLWLSVYGDSGFSLGLGTLPYLLKSRVPFPLH